jgi:hypothetical protein
MVAWGCYFDRNRGPYPVTYWQKLVGCTIGPDNVTLDGRPASVGSSPVSNNNWSSPEVVGTLMCLPNVQAGAVMALTNCAFSSAWLENWPSGIITNNSCVIVPTKKLATANGLPIIGANDAVDRGEKSWWDEEYCGTTDAQGNQRVYNGAIDIGAFEADWRGVYARALGRRITVSSADPSVVRARTKGVFISDG